MNPLLAIIVLAIGMSWLSFIGRFFGLKLIAGMAWFVALIIVVTNPPTGIVVGSNEHTGLIVILAGFGIMLVLSGFRKNMQNTFKTSSAKGERTEESENGSWHFPSWVANMNPEHEERERRQKRVDKVVAYRERVHTVLNQRRNRR